MFVFPPRPTLFYGYYFNLNHLLPHHTCGVNRYGFPCYQNFSKTDFTSLLFYFHSRGQNSNNSTDWFLANAWSEVILNKFYISDNNKTRWRDVQVSIVKVFRRAHTFTCTSPGALIFKAKSRVTLFSVLGLNSWPSVTTLCWEGDSAMQGTRIL